MLSRKSPGISGLRAGTWISGVLAFAALGFSAATVEAGDLLRGGYTAAHGGSASPGSFTPPSITEARQNAQDMLSRTTQAVQSMQSVQRAARAIAAAANNAGKNPNNPSQPLPNVANGLNVGGLVPDSGLKSAGVANPVSTWVGAGTPVQTVSGGNTIVTIVQTAQDAYLNWNSFNIGKKTTLDFNQKGGSSVGNWIAFNFVNDPSGLPSQILGAMNAPGQVYVIDQNGIIFGGGSQVNLHALVASSLPIDTYLSGNSATAGRGLLNNPDDQFLFSALPQPGGANGSPAFAPPAANTPSGLDGNVVVEAGAELTAPTTPDHVGGRIALIGPEVTNNGTISTPDGQTILAAGLQVGFVAHSTDDPEIRGLDAFVGKVSSPSYAAGAIFGTAANNGQVDAPRGNIAVVGKAIDQFGILAATTSVTLNGSIDLLADYNSASGGGVLGVAPFLPQNAGAITLGPDSVSEILPELDSTERVVGSSLALYSQVEMQGKTIHMEGNSTLFAPSAQINLNAGDWNYLITGNGPVSTFVASTGQIYLDANAAIYAAGSADVSASVTENIITAQLLGPELADSPVQRTGPFVDQTVYIDIRDSGVYNGFAWVGTPLADVSGYANLVERTVGELTVNGGTVNLTAGGSVVMQPGSEINVSGGWIDYQGGVVQTTEVISGGHIYPISEAYPNMVYQGFNLGTFTLDHLKYGLSATFTNPLLDLSHYEDSYVYGGNGGTVSITAPAVALDGQLVGQTVPGPRQLTVLPTPSAFNLAFEAQQLDYPAFTEYSPTPPAVVFSPDITLPPVAGFSVDSSGNPAPLSVPREDEVVLSPDLFTTGGFGALKLNDSDGNVSVPAGVTLDPGPEGSISVTAANVNIQGSILAPGGSVSFTVYDFSPFTPPTSLPSSPDFTRGHFILGSSASLDLAGLVLDDRANSPTADTLPVVTSGGSVSIQSLSADLSPGSVINVDGGVEMTTSGKPVYGNGGSIAISAGQDPGISALVGGGLTLGGELEGFSGAAGGSLSILDTLVQIGGAATHPGTFLVDPSFFDQGGFSRFTLTGLGETTSQAGVFVPAVYIVPGTEIAPYVTSLVAEPGLTGDQQVTLVEDVLPVGVRAPVSLTFKAPGVTDNIDVSVGLVIRGDIVMGEGSEIRTDPGASVTLSGKTVAVLGSIYAPAGTITITGAQDSTGLLFPGALAGSVPTPTVDLGPRSVLSAAGTTVLTANAYGYRTGSVLNGGSITVSGNIVAEVGSVIDVSGATNTLDLTPVQANASATPGGAANPEQNGSLLGMMLVPTRVDSNGGTIVLKGSQELFTDATLLGAPGGPSAIGGTLSVSSGLIGSPTPLDVTLVVTQNGSTIPASFYPAGQDAIGHAVVDKGGNVITPRGYIAVDSFSGGGFNSVDINGTVQFSGPINISTPGSLTVATGGVIFADAAVHLTSNYVALGLPFVAPGIQQSPFLFEGAPFNFLPTYGPGSLTVTANLIDIGTLSLQNIGKANFIADGGDIRGDGTLDVAGQIYMRAGQVYVPTDVSFTIAAYDYTSGATTEQGKVVFAASGERELPLSAAGILNVYATNIVQDGVLRAPFGEINLGWNGSGTAPVDPITGQAFDATQQLTLGAGSITSVSGVDPATSLAEIVPYGTNLNGTSWIDPAGIDITAGGIPQKSITISAVNVNDEHGAVIDIQGGGDLMAYRFVSGLNGTQDILGSNSNFAILPGYQADYAPYDVVNTNSTLAVGDQVYLNGSAVLSAGYYTLLPARYALLPGGILVSPQSGLPAGPSQSLPDGGVLVSGYRSNVSETAPGITTSFELDTWKVVANRAEYDLSYANSFLAAGAKSNGQPVPRLPEDSGQLVFQATSTLAIAGQVDSVPLAGGLGGIVDISSPSPILIAAPGVTQAGALVLDASELDSFGAASLLIGGIRQSNANGATVTVTADDITVDNSGSPLTGQDIVLAANDNITIDPGAEIESSGGGGNAGNISVAGNGVLVRVSSDPSATVTRTGVTSASAPMLVIGAGAKIDGGSVTLDSSAGTNLDPTAVITGKSLALNSGQITLELTNPGTIAPTTGLVLASAALQQMETSAVSFSLLSYSSIDIYGTGQVGGVNAQNVPTLENLALHAGSIAGFNDAAGTVAFAAKTILLDNAPNSPAGTAGSVGTGTLEFDANTVELGANTLAIQQFGTVNINATAGILAMAKGGLSTAGAMNLAAPIVTGIEGSNETFTAAGSLSIATPAAAATSAVTGGFGATLAFVGSAVSDNGNIVLPSGSITLHATAGSLTVGDQSAATLDVSGEARNFFDLTKYTDGGQIDLQADAGNITVGSLATLTVAAQAGGGNAGTLSISAPQGTLGIFGNLSAQAASGQGGTFILDVGSLPSLSSLDASLNAANFDGSRTIRVRTGNVLVDGNATAQTFDLSADAGDITVAGTIDAGGNTGGTVDLQAWGSVTLLSGADVSVAATNYSAAGRGGSVSLEAGSETNGSYDTAAEVNIEAGSTIDLSVAATAAAGDLSGALLLRAPQTAAHTDLQVDPIAGTIVGASSIVAEGYAIFNAPGGSIDSEESAIMANGNTFAGNTSSIVNRLTAGNSALASLIEVAPGAEIIDLTGDLTLANTWDLSTYRFGSASVPGYLTLRAAGNVVFDAGASLTDGFTHNSTNYWDAPLMSVGTKSWSYSIVAGADFSGANFNTLQPLASLAAGSGSVLIGEGSLILPTDTESSRSIVLQEYFQTIRTGEGSIDIYAGRDVQLLDTLATIYSAGTQAPALAGFTLPNINYTKSQLSTVQSPLYPVQYTEYGGSVTVVAQNDIAHSVDNGFGQLIPDSSLELPTNWLYRQGAINPATGGFTSASTSWWTDFSNFVEGVGSFGGGNVTLSAGHDVSNVDAVIPTNARIPNSATSISALLELGGGNLLIQAGNDINGGVYYVERGQGTLNAGNQILTNSTRATVDEQQEQFNQSIGATPDPSTWLPTTLFAGDASFNITAGGDILMGPVANPFLLPQGINNSYLNRSYFSTYASTDAVNVQSLAGNVTIKNAADNGGDGSLQAWYDFIDGQSADSGSYAANSYPWLRTVEPNTDNFATIEALMPGTLRVTAFTGSIDLVGTLLLSPAPDGTLDLAAAGSINGMQVNSFDSSNGLEQWGTAIVDLSDANPASIPGILDPLTPIKRTPTFSADLDFIDSLFAETGSVEGSAGVIQTQEALHDPGLLHAGDTNPVHLYAAGGDISGFTLYSAKFTRAIASQDITDIALYIQNDNSDDVSVVSAGRDIIAYDVNSPLRIEAQQAGNELIGYVNGVSGLIGAVPGSGTPTPGDIQISGPGALEVLAGRDLTLGAGENNLDGTAVGITSIGNGRNPYLPFDGAQIDVAAGLGDAADGLANSSLQIASFVTQVLEGTGGARYFGDLAQTDSGLDVSSIQQFDALDSQQQALVALDLFYLVLRDAGRDHNTLGTTGYGNYSAGMAAVAALFPGGGASSGYIDLTSKEVKTVNGGDIDLLAPGGQITVGIDLPGTEAVDQGVITEDGGNISIYSQGSVNVGTSRVFTLRGGNEIIWSGGGDIDAGNAAKTVQSAPPTRVLVDPQSGNVETDLAGLATGGGIGVLASIVGVPPGDVDLIAPSGIIDAGNAGIRATGNLNLAAVQVVNAFNIQAAGSTSGAPTVVVSTPNLGGFSAGNAAAAAGDNAGQQASQANQPANGQDDAPSLITVDVLVSSDDDSAQGG